MGDPAKAKRWIFECNHDDCNFSNPYDYPTDASEVSKHLIEERNAGEVVKAKNNE